ncbi:MAG: hypothetical protein MK089_01490 [Phycisphaerales bacterium]|nr:hypothetical protein [Phycisphaerales bacterium]
MQDLQSDRRSRFGAISLGMGIVLWLIQIISPIVGLNVLGQNFTGHGVTGSEAMSDSQVGAFIIMIIIGAAGLASIFGFILGLIGLTTSAKGCRMATIGAALNGICWVATAVFFVWVSSY